MSTIATDNKLIQTERLAVKHLWWITLLAAAVSVTGNLSVLMLGKSLFSISFMMPQGFGAAELVPLELSRVIILSVIPAFGAAGLFAILGKFLSRPLRVFWIISIVFLLVSFIPDLILPVDWGTKIGLMVMHVVSAGAIVGFLTTLGRVK
jgi:hypothetical protein